MTQQAPPAQGPMQAPATWDAVAPTYAQDVHQWDTYAREALRLVPPAPGDRVLDVACGPGTLAFFAASRAARVDAIDFSPEMVAQLRQRAEREGVKNLESAVMDAQALEFPDATFDAAFCIFAFFFFPDRPRAFGELRRVLRPGGRALIATWGPIERRPIMKVGIEAVAEVLPNVPKPQKGDLQDPAECVREMTDAGFRDVEAHVFTASTRFASAEAYVDLMLRSGAPFALMRKRLGEQEWSSLRTRLIEAVRRKLPDGSAELSAEAILTIGTR